MKTILRITSFFVAFIFLAWAYFNYPFMFCPGVKADGGYMPCDLINMHGFLNAKYYPLGYGVAAMAALAAIVFVYMEIQKHRKNNKKAI